MLLSICKNFVIIWPTTGLFNSNLRLCGDFVAVINYASHEVNCKIVFYGPGLSGKTSNLRYIHDKLDPKMRGKLISLDTSGERTLFFDFLPVELGKVHGLTMRLQIYTVPGQVYYNESRKLVLKGLDGLVFVADSQESRREANIFSIQNMYDNLEAIRVEWAKLPIIIQFNKRDVSNVQPISLMQRELNPTNYMAFESNALHGVGVIETLKAITKLAVKSVDGQLRKT